MSIKTKTETILVVMNVLAWITFIGLMIEAGAILVTYGIGLANPKMVTKLYKGMDWDNLRQYDVWYYTGIITLKAAILILEAYTAYMVIKVLSTIKMTNPFTMQVAKKLENIAYTLILVWVAVLIYNGQLRWLSKNVADLEGKMLSTEFILMGAVIYIIATIFKKGVDIQNENDLTV
jgi:hypothetical protein